jgi:hypothetical protein
MKKILTLIFLLIAFTGFSQKKVKISMVYPGAGNTSKAVYKYNFVELHNVSIAEVNIGGWSIQYGSKTGNFASSSPNLYEFPANTKIAAGGFLLIKVGSLSTSPSATTDIASGNDLKSAEGEFTMSNSGGGKVALVTENAALGCGGNIVGTSSPCDPGAYAVIEDIVAWGGASNPEGVAINNNDPLMIMVRKGNGCTDTDNNAADFDVVTSASPRNKNSAVVSCSGVPVVLTNFSVQKVNGGVQVNWATSQEQNSSHFIVESSTDQSNWKTVTTVAAAGNSASANNYSATDNNPSQGVNYYRLKMVDLDNSFVTSAVKSVSFSNGFSVSISPNPASSFINVELSGNNSSSRVILSDLNGKVVYNQITTAPKLQINSSAFAKGMYIIKVINGTEVNTSKVMVQ